LQRVYVKSLDFWPEEDESRLEQMIESNHVRWAVEDLMEIEEERPL
jgi:hypothetical protein